MLVKLLSAACLRTLSEPFASASVMCGWANAIVLKRMSRHAIGHRKYRRNLSVKAAFYICLGG